MWNGKLQLGHMNHTTPSVVPSGVGGDAAHRGQAMFRGGVIPLDRLCAAQLYTCRPRAVNNDRPSACQLVAVRYDLPHDQPVVVRVLQIRSPGCPTSCHRDCRDFVLRSAALFIAGCGGSSSPAPTPVPNVPFSQTDIVVGTGADAVNGKTLTVNYTVGCTTRRRRNRRAHSSTPPQDVVPTLRARGRAGHPGLGSRHARDEGRWHAQARHSAGVWRTALRPG